MYHAGKALRLSPRANRFIRRLAHQLRGSAEGRQVPDARLAIAENGGGLIGVEEAVACITILGR